MALKVVSIKKCWCQGLFCAKVVIAKGCWGKRLSVQKVVGERVACCSVVCVRGCRVQKVVDSLTEGLRVHIFQVHFGLKPCRIVPASHLPNSGG